MLSRNEDKMTSLGREDPHVSIHVLDKDRVENLAPNKNNIKDSSPAASLLSLPPPTLSSSEVEKEGNILTLDVPDKVNIDCDLAEGGSIFVESKIEGDVRLKTAQGNISVQKLRGHSIDLEIASSEEEKVGDDEESRKASFIFVSDVLESQSLRLAIPRPSIDRIRARRIHAKTMEIRVGDDDIDQSMAFTPSAHHEESLLDSDDSGAICDISSLYIIGDANVVVQQPTSLDKKYGRQRQAVRIKSHHGHVNVQASAPKPNINNYLTGEILPLIDLGGVNGSCEVWVCSNTKKNNSISVSKDENDWTSCHVHFDSIAPDSVSLLHAEDGNIHVTVDRKVESDVRFISPPSDVNIDTEILLLEDNEDGSMADEMSNMLEEMEMNAVAAESHTKNIAIEKDRIRIETQAFTSRERAESSELQHCEFVDGWIENTTSEPDSRFDRKIRGNSGVGKINIEGAQNQALHSFGVDKTSGDETAGDTFVRPLLAASSPGNIILESLSWMGNIARRYGFDDNREDDDLGRQATRRKGLGREIPTNE